MKRVFSIFLSFWLVLATLGLAAGSVTAHAAEAVSPEWGGISISDRWKITTARPLITNLGNQAGFIVQFEDPQYTEADGLLTIMEARVALNRYSLKDWVHKVEIPAALSMRKITLGDTKRETTITLSGGVSATVLEQEFVHQGRTRYVTFVSSEFRNLKNDKLYYVLLRVYNWDRTKKLSPESSPLKDLLAGVKLPIKDTLASISLPLPNPNVSPPSE